MTLTEIVRKQIVRIFHEHHHLDLDDADIRIIGGEVHSHQNAACVIHKGPLEIVVIAEAYLIVDGSYLVEIEVLHYDGEPADRAYSMVVSKDGDLTSRS